MLKVITNIGSICQWTVLIFLSSSVALASTGDNVNGSSLTTWTLFLSVVVGSWIQILCIDHEFRP